MILAGSLVPRRQLGPLLRRGSLTLAALGLAAAINVAWPASTALAATYTGPCNRIQVETSDRGVLLSAYVVSAPEYVAKMHLQIDRDGQDGVLTVAAGDLGAVGYVVTYSCLP